jgi:hypothetical protein
MEWQQEREAVAAAAKANVADDAAGNAGRGLHSFT